MWRGKLMKIIIIGCGKIGYNLAENLAEEGNEVVIVDKNAEVLKTAVENLDVMCINGSGVSTNVLLEAGARGADLLIAATAGDEMNMICCLTAKSLGVKHTIARIRDTQYANELSTLKHDLGLDMIINPEQEVAAEISRLLQFSPALNVEVFAGNQVEIIDICVKKDMPIIDKKLKDLASEYSASILIGAVLREDCAIIPDGEFMVRENDRLYIVGKPAMLYEFCLKCGIRAEKIKAAMIMGGGRIGYYLAKYLDSVNIKVKIIEKNYEQCKELAKQLPHAVIIHGDGSDGAVLEMENIDKMSAFISVTGHDEDNLIAAFFAKEFGVPKVIAKTSRPALPKIVKTSGIDNLVRPNLVTANQILRFARGLKNAVGNPVNALYKIVEGKAEAVEFTVGGASRLVNTPLKDLYLKKEVLIAAIARGGEILIPHGDDLLKPGDLVVIITRNMYLSDLDSIAYTEGAQ
ncbi:MAG: Trk system potassium transporter TrkA [Acidaminococcales bacterium]|nr:Trk system potassium transporter TrkA [Acidaminococcales bacterium]